LEHGASTSDELLKAIEESEATLVVFSKTYAMSRSSELKGQLVKAFAKHELKYKDDVDSACFLADTKENKEMHSLQNILLSELLRKN
ncbi:hypothetical protein H5410_027954, partial [Solanum commersonii]